MHQTETDLSSGIQKVLLLICQGYMDYVVRTRVMGTASSTASNQAGSFIWKSCFDTEITFSRIPLLFMAS